MSEKPTLEELKSAIKIPDILMGMFDGLLRRELVRRVYNEAIDDAANFVRDLAPHNPQQSSALVAAGKEIRKWLTIPSEKEIE